MRHLTLWSCSSLTMCLDTVKSGTIPLLLFTDVQPHFVSQCRAQVNMCVHVCVMRKDRLYPLSLSLYPLLVSLSTLKIFCQAHSFDDNLVESRSSLRVQTARGAQRAAKALPAYKKNTQTLLNTLLNHVLWSPLISSYYGPFSLKQMPITARRLALTS